jgi:hypothetical protein
MAAHDEKRIAELRQEITATEEKLRAASEALNREFPAYAELSAPKALSLTAAQDLLAPDELPCSPAPTK